MLKKLGIVVATAAVSMLAVSPLAFATDTAGNTRTESHGNGSLVNLSDNDLVAPLQACNNDIPINGGAGTVQNNVKELTGGASGALALLGVATSSSNVQSDSHRDCDQKTVNVD